MLWWTGRSRSEAVAVNCVEEHVALYSFLGRDRWLCFLMEEADGVSGIGKYVNSH
jgi:hypothetical protein